MHKRAEEIKTAIDAVRAEIFKLRGDKPARKAAPKTAASKATAKPAAKPAAKKPVAKKPPAQGEPHNPPQPLAPGSWCRARRAHDPSANIGKQVPE